MEVELSGLCDNDNYHYHYNNGNDDDNVPWCL